MDGGHFCRRYIVYHELVMTSKEFMQCVTSVEPEWLSELGPMFFSIKMAGDTRAEKRRQERENKAKMEREMAAYQERKAQKAEDEARLEGGSRFGSSFRTGSSFRARGQSGSAARHRIATPGAGGAGAHGSASSARSGLGGGLGGSSADASEGAATGSSVVRKSTPKPRRFGM